MQNWKQATRSNKLEESTKVLKGLQILDDVKIRESRELYYKLESTQDLTRKGQIDTASICKLIKNISTKEMTIAELQNKKMESAEDLK